MIKGMSLQQAIKMRKRMSVIFQHPTVFIDRTINTPSKGIPAQRKKALTDL